MAEENMSQDNNTKVPFEVVAVNAETNEDLLNSFRGEHSGYYYVGKEKYLMPCKYKNELNKYYNCPVRDDDVWISTFPRSGTTLTQDLVWLLKNDFDFETAKKINIWGRSPFFEISLFFHDKTKSMLLKENEGNDKNKEIIENMSKPGYLVLEATSSPRTIKTHFPLSLLPQEVHEKKCKIVYVARNPKDVVISYYHLCSTWRTSNYTGSFAKFWKQFKEGHVPWGPFWNHILEGWVHRNDPNVLFLFYEDMVKDMEATIRKIADFLSVPASADKVKALSEHLSLKSFSKNEAVNFETFKDIGILKKDGKAFVRTGAKREKPEGLNDEIEKEIEDWIKENYGKTDLRFPGK